MTDYSFYSDAFTEWTTLFVYASDIFLILAIFFWIFFIFKNFSYLSEVSKSIYNKFKKGAKLPKVWLFLLVFFIWITLNLAINNNYPKINIFQTVKLIELSLLVIFVYFNFKNSKTLFTSLFIIVFSGFLQSLIAIYQFIAQHSVFSSPILAKITGESVIGPQIPGVAKIAVDGEKIIRAYGTFPHPNILGGFLIFTTVITIYLYLEHKRCSLSSQLDFRAYSENKKMFIYICLTQIFKFVYIKTIKFLRLFQYNNINSIQSQDILYSLLWITLIFVQTAAIFFTFSRTAWIGFLLSLFVISVLYLYDHKIVSRETILLKPVNNYKKILKLLFCYKELIIVCFLSLFLIISNFSLIQARIDGALFSNDTLSNNSAFSDRTFYNIVSRETISNNFLFGSGIGTSIFQINNYLENNNIKQELESWQYQPAHNIYFLIASEIGLVGLLIFLLFIIYVILGSIKIVSRETILDIRKLNYFLIAILISFLFIGIFDHYFWTLQQGRLIFWLVLALILAISRNTQE